jgi:serralysin
MGEAAGDRLVSIEGLFGSNYADTLYGDAFANIIAGAGGNDVILGMAGNDSLSGGNGNDRLVGGAGIDTLTGGAGTDYFVFNAGLSPSNVDRIADFSVVSDTIMVENAVMPGLGAVMTAAKFWKSTTGLAHDGDDRLIYETDTGRLTYDSNGSAAGGAIHIATLNPGLALTHTDFVVI